MQVHHQTAPLAVRDTVAFSLDVATGMASVFLNDTSILTDVKLQTHGLQPALFPVASLLVSGVEVDFQWSYT